MKKLLICFLAITLISCLDEPKKEGSTTNTPQNQPNYNTQTYTPPVVTSTESSYSKNKENEVSNLKTEIENLLKDNIKNANAGFIRAHIDTFEDALYIDNRIYPLNNVNIFYYYNNSSSDYGYHYIRFACKDNSDCIQSSNSSPSLAISIPIKNEEVVLEIRDKISKLRSLL